MSHHNRQAIGETVHRPLSPSLHRPRHLFDNPLGSSLGTLVKAAAEDPTGDAAKALSELDFDDVAIEPEGLDVQGEDPES